MSTGLATEHPLYIVRKPDWRQMRDTYEGERAVKEAGTLYLPMTSGMIEDGALQSVDSDGWKAYAAYRLRARFPDLVDEAVSALLGVMHSKPPKITLPRSMEYLRQRASSRGESLVDLLKRINHEQMVTGRLGLLADVIDTGPRANEFYLALYQGEDAINWDASARSATEVESLNLVVLDETASVRDPQTFAWRTVQRYRVLVLGTLDQNVYEGAGTYRAGVFIGESNDSSSESLQYDESQMREIRWRGRASQRIPFTFINAEDVAHDPGKPPLLGLSNLTLTIYRGEADYRQSLFQQGQDTLVLIGVPDAPSEAGDTARQRTRIGVGAVLKIGDNQGDAKFIGVDSEGLSEQRTALQNDYSRGEQFAGRLMDSTTRERESGDALRIRVATRTATLNQIAQAGAYGLQRVLRGVAEWMGEDPESVIVEPNMDFVDDQMTGEQLRALLDAKEKGAPVSLRTIHDVMSVRSLTRMDFDTELAAIVEEAPLMRDLLVVRQALAEVDASAAARVAAASRPESEDTDDPQEPNDDSDSSDA